MSAQPQSTRQANPFGDPAPLRAEGAADLRAAIEACAQGTDAEAIAAVGPGYRWLEYFAPTDATPLAVAASRPAATLLERALGGCCVEPEDAAALEALESALKANSAACASALLRFGVKMDLRCAAEAIPFDNLESLREGLGKGKPSAKSINKKIGEGACERLFALACENGAEKCVRWLLGMRLDWRANDALHGLRALGRDRRDELLLLALREGGLGENEKTARLAAMARKEPFQAFYEEKALAGLLAEAQGARADGKESGKGGSRRL